MDTVFFPLLAQVSIVGPSRQLLSLHLHHPLRLSRRMRSPTAPPSTQAVLRSLRPRRHPRPLRRQPHHPSRVVRLGAELKASSSAQSEGLMATLR